MKALAILPGKADSVHLRDIDEPPEADGSILCEMLAIGLCGTDKELIEGAYGMAPSGSDFLVIGHESLGRVIQAPENSSFKPGDLVAGIVRRPDPVPCACCAVGEWDMCQNGEYTERGIKMRHGFCSERFRLEPEFCIKISEELAAVGMLMEPASVVAKAWEHTERIYQRSAFQPKRVLVTGAGPVGLLAAMMGMQRNFDVHVLDHNKTGPKPKLVETLGATYHSDADSAFHECEKFDLVFECTGATSVILKLLNCIAPNGVVCLTGITEDRTAKFDIGHFNREMVLENQVIFGTVNANRRHFESAARALSSADLKWLESLITKRVPLSEWRDAFAKTEGNIKTVIVRDSQDVRTN